MPCLHILLVSQMASNQLLPISSGLSNQIINLLRIMHKRRAMEACRRAVPQAAWRIHGLFHDSEWNGRVRHSAETDHQSGQSHHAHIGKSAASFCRYFLNQEHGPHGQTRRVACLLSAQASIPFHLPLRRLILSEFSV